MGTDQQTIAHPRPTFDFLELEAAIDAMLAEAEAKERNESGSLPKCVMCTHLGSMEDVEGLL